MLARFRPPDMDAEVMRKEAFRYYHTHGVLDIPLLCVLLDELVELSFLILNFLLVQLVILR